MECHRAFVLQDGRTVGVFRLAGRKTQVCLVLEPDAACFTYADNKNQHLRQVTSCCLSRLRPAVTTLLAFRNRHSARPYVPRHLLPCTLSLPAPLRRTRWPVAWCDSLCHVTRAGSPCISSLDRLCVFTLGPHRRRVKVSWHCPMAVSETPRPGTPPLKSHPHACVEQTFPVESCPGWLLPPLSLALEGKGDAKERSAGQGCGGGTMCYSTVDLPRPVTVPLQKWITTDTDTLKFMRMAPSAAEGDTIERLPPCLDTLQLVVDWTPSATFVLSHGSAGVTVTAHVPDQSACLELMPLMPSMSSPFVHTYKLAESPGKALVFPLASFPNSTRASASEQHALWLVAQHAGQLQRSQCGGTSPADERRKKVDESCKSSASEEERSSVLPGWGRFTYNAATDVVRVQFEDRAILYLQPDDRFELVLPTGRVLSSRVSDELKQTLEAYQCYLHPALEFRLFERTPPARRACIERKRKQLRAEVAVALRSTQTFLAVHEIRQKYMAAAGGGTSG